MKKHVILLVSLVIGLALLSASLIAFASGLLDNGDFESGEDPWYYTYEDGNTYFKYSTAYYCLGSACASGKSTLHIWAHPYITQSLTAAGPITEGVYSLYWQQYNRYETLNPGLTWKVSGPAGITYVSGVVTSAYGTWIQQSESFTLPDTNAAILWFLQNYQGGYAVDNVLLVSGTYTPTIPPEDCTFTNYDFDDGDEGWETVGSPEFVSSTVRLGLNEGISQTLSLEPGLYYVTTYAKSEGTGEDITSRLFVEAGKDGEVWWDSEFWIGSTWRETEMVMEIPPSDEGDYFFRFSSIYDEHPDTTIVLEWVCLSGEDWDAIDHPLCYADSQDILRDFADTEIGIDYAAPLGSGVFAVGPGQIVIVTETISGSLYIEQEVTAEDLGDTYLIRYENVNDVQVLPGQLAVTGQLLGYVGENPEEEEPYLHFSVYDPYLESYVDPELLFSDNYPSCLSFGLEDCVLVNADFDHPVGGGWIYTGGWIYGNGAGNYREGDNIGAYLPITTSVPDDIVSGYIFQSVWLPEMPEPGYYTLIFDARALDDAAIEVQVENSVISTTATISMTERWDDAFIDISDFAESQILVQFTAIGEVSDGIMLDNTCIIFTPENEGNPIDYDCDFPPFPEGYDPWEWLKWLGAVIEWLWCMLRVWLHKLWLAILSLPETIKEFLTQFWTEIIKPALKWLFESLGLGWLWDWLEFTVWPWLTDPEYGGLATWIALIIDLLGQFINDPLGTLDALLSALVNAVLGFIFSIPAVQTAYDVIMAFVYLLGLLWEIIASVATILWQAIVFVVTLASSAVYALQHPDEIEDIDVSPLAVGIQLAQDAIALTPLIYLEALTIGLLAWVFIMWVIRQFGAQT